jgi:hypothetical protein
VVVPCSVRPRKFLYKGEAKAAAGDGVPSSVGSSDGRRRVRVGGVKSGSKQFKQI